MFYRSETCLAHPTLNRPLPIMPKHELQNGRFLPCSKLPQMLLAPFGPEKSSCFISNSIQYSNKIYNLERLSDLIFEGLKVPGSKCQPASSGSNLAPFYELQRVDHLALFSMLLKFFQPEAVPLGIPSKVDGRWP